MYAGAPDLNQGAGQGEHACEVKFGLCVVTAGACGLSVCQDAIATDYLIGVLIPDQQVLAIRIEAVAFDPRMDHRQARTHFFDEHAMAQALGGLQVLNTIGQPDAQPVLTVRAARDRHGWREFRERRSGFPGFGVEGVIQTGGVRHGGFSVVVSCDHACRS